MALGEHVVGCFGTAEAGATEREKAVSDTGIVWRSVSDDLGIVAVEVLPVERCRGA